MNNECIKTDRKQNVNVWTGMQQHHLYSYYNWTGNAALITQNTWLKEHHVYDMEHHTHGNVREQVRMLSAMCLMLSVIYTIICLKSVCLSGDVRRIQFAILDRSPREMSQTDRIHPRYFLSRVRVSIRPRFFYTRKTANHGRSARRSRSPLCGR